MMTFIVTAVHGQSRALLEGNKHFAKGEFHESIADYKNVVSVDKRNVEGLTMMALAYEKLGDFESSALFFRKAIRVDRHNDQLKFDYGKVLMSQGNYALALEIFEEYRRDNPQDRRASNFISWCEEVDNYLIDSSLYKVRELPINSRRNDALPAFYEDGIVFCSERTMERTSALVKSGHLLYSRPNGKTTWSKPEGPVGLANHQRELQALTFSASGQQVYVSYTAGGDLNPFGSVNPTVSMLGSMIKTNGKWSELEALPFNSFGHKFDVKQPSLSADATRLYFSSDMPGGFGGLDLYFVERTEQGVWGAPVNLGPNVNTQGDEQYPFVHQDQTVYFASDGHGGFGGNDLFATVTRHDGKWEVPQNLGFPINSAWDDNSIMFEGDKRVAYLSSNRKGGRGMLDIYKVEVNERQALAMLRLDRMMSTPMMDQTTEQQPDGQISQVSESAGAASYTTYNQAKLQELNVAFLGGRHAGQLTFFMIGIVLDATSLEKVRSAEVELRNLQSGEITKYTTERDGNFYFELEANQEYVLIKRVGRQVEDFHGISTYNRSNSKILHAILEANRLPEQVQDANRRYEEMYSDYGALVKSDVPKIQVSPAKNAPRDTFRIESQNYGNPRSGAKETSVPARTVVEPTVAPKEKEESIAVRPIEAPINDFETVNFPVKKEVIFKIQVGSFFSEVDPDKRFLRKLDGKHELEQTRDNLFRYLVGSFTNRSEAVSFKNHLVSIGYPSAFIVVYFNGERLDMDVENALQYIQQF
ncbi:tetratricopeptide repeat protein [Chitinophagales bacterium]|nr:tetratricopeptide repeat protein [Chitinophagales bacterium]